MMMETGEPDSSGSNPTFGPDPETGGKYEVAVATLVAANLSMHPDVQDYHIFRNLTEAEPFADVVAKVLFKKEYYAYAIQVKHYIDGEYLRVPKYQTGYSAICGRRGFNTIGPIAHDKIHFSYLCIKNVTNKGKCKPYEVNLTDCETSDLWRSALSLENCYKLGETLKGQDFFNKFYLYFDQPDLRNITEKITKVCKIKDAMEILDYAYNFLTHPVLRVKGLSKEVFESELLKIRLSDNIVPLVNVRLNNLTSEICKKLTSYDITIVKTEANIEKILYGLLAQMNGLFAADKWNDYKIQMDSIVSKNFEKRFITDNRVRHWINAPTTLKTLIMELWKYGELPLILKADEELLALKDYARLKKKCIIVTDNLDRRREEFNKIPSSVFTFINDIKSHEVRNDILKNIRISFQGRKPIELHRLFAESKNELEKTISFSHILHLVKSRNAYLSKECLKGKRNIVFLIEDSTPFEQYDFNKINPSGRNITIKGRSEQINWYYEQIKQNEKLQSYKIVRCLTSSENENLTLVEGDKNLLSDFFVDEDEEAVYIEKDNAIVPIVGLSLKNIQQNYIPKYLRTAIISKTLFDERTKGIYLFSGNISDLNLNINLVKEAEEKMEFNNENRFIDVSDKDVDKYWKTALHLKCPLLHVHIEGSAMKLYKSKNWKGLTNCISYRGRRILEKNILGEIKDRITVLTGEQGIGKSSLLRSLFMTEKVYTLFYDLCDYGNYLEKHDSVHNSLDFIFQQLQNKPYKEFLYGLLQNKRVLVLLDSFDKVKPQHREATLNFIQNLTANNVKIIIATSFDQTDILLENFEINIFEVRSDCNHYIKHRKLNEKATMSREISGNPLYVKVLETTTENDINMKYTNKYLVIEKLVDKKLNEYLQNCPSSTCSSDLKKIVRERQLKLALEKLLGVDVVKRLLNTREEKKLSQHLKSKPINEQDHTSSLHATFPEYLTATWLIENIKTHSAKKIYLEILNQNKLDVLEILYAGLKLHNAVVQQNTKLVQEATSILSHLKQTDRLGRSSLHVAAAYWDRSQSWICWEGGPSDFNNMINIIIERIRQRDLNAFLLDNLMDWNWVQHLNRGDVIDMKPCSKFLVTTMEVYVHSIVKKILKGIKLDVKNFSGEPMKDMWLAGMTTCKIDLIRDLFLIVDVMSNGIPSASRHRPQNLEKDKLQLRKVWGFTPLHYACLYGKLNVVKSQKFENLESYVNIADDFGCTPIFYSIINPFTVRIEMTKILLEKGSTVNSPTSFGQNPLSLAVSSGKSDITELLLQNNDDIDNINKCLFIALERKYQDIAMLLITRNNANVNYADQDGRTALISAITTNNSECTKLLIEYGADVNIATADGKTPLFYASDANNLDIVKLLLEKGADINSIMGNGQTLLSYVLNREEILNFLLEKMDSLKIKVEIQ